MTMMDAFITLAAGYRSMCAPCQRGEHYDCIDVAPTTDGSCHCRCVGYVCCPTCESDVVLWSEDEPNAEDPSGIASGHCCHWMWADWWEGTFRYDLSGKATSDG